MEHLNGTQHLYKDSTETHIDSIGFDLIIHPEDSIYSEINYIDCSNYTPSITGYTVTFSDNSDTVIDLNKPMVYFSDSIKFKEAMRIIDYRNDSVLNDWENSQSFVSLRRAFSFTEYSSIDELASAIENTSSDNALVSLLNEQSSIRIGDSLYVSFFNKGEVVLIDLNSYEHSSINLRDLEDCDTRTIVYMKGYDADYKPCQLFEAEYMLFGLKYNDITFASAIVGCGIKIASKLSSGGWVLSSAKFHMRKDPWHRVCFKKANQNNYTCVTIDILMENKIFDSKYYNYNFKKVIRFLPKPLCVNKFERVHYWKWNYNEDLHIDDWQ